MTQSVKNKRKWANQSFRQWPNQPVNQLKRQWVSEWPFYRNAGVCPLLDRFWFGASRLPSQVQQNCPFLQPFRAVCHCHSQCRASTWRNSIWCNQPPNRTCTNSNRSNNQNGVWRNSVRHLANSRVVWAREWSQYVDWQQRQFEYSTVQISVLQYSNLTTVTDGRKDRKQN